MDPSVFIETGVRNDFWRIETVLSNGSWWIKTGQ